MRKTRLITLLPIAFLLLFLVLGSGGRAMAEDQAADFNIKDIDGNNLTLSQFKGQKVVLLDFMATWCSSCKVVEGNLQTIYPDYRDRVAIISIDIDPTETDAKLRTFRDDHKIPWYIARDTDSLKTKYAVTEIAKIVVINKNRDPTFENVGVTSVEDLRKNLDRALTGDAPTINIQQMSIFAVAIVAGIASFFSPCAFPMLPGYMSLYLGLEQEQLAEDAKKGTAKKMNKGRAFMAGGTTAFGVITAYIILGVIVILAAGTVTPYVPMLQPIIGIILIVLGAIMFTNIQYWRIVAPFQRLGQAFRKKPKEDAPRPQEVAKKERFYGKLFGYGVGYGAAAAGCVAPLFIAVILTAMLGSILDGIIALMLFSLTSAILMIVITVILAVVSRKSVDKLKQYTPMIKKVSAVVLVIVGIYLVGFYLYAWYYQ